MIRRSGGESAGIASKPTEEYHGSAQEIAAATSVLENWANTTSRQGSRVFCERKSYDESDAIRNFWSWRARHTQSQPYIVPRKSRSCLGDEIRRR